jgi:hypothetical protein
VIIEPTPAATYFPAIFVSTLAGIFQTEMGSPTIERGDNPVPEVLLRPINPDDPNYSMSVFEGEADPIEYEIGGGTDPTLMRWQVITQVYAKSANEIDGRAVRSKLLNRARKTLFSSTTENALMLLTDTETQEACRRYRLRRIAFASGDGPRAGEFYFLGQIELIFETESR